MFLEQRLQFFSPQQFALPTAGCLGTQQKFSIDRTWPIEEILLVVNFTVKTTKLTFNTTVNTPDQFDNILQIVQHVNLSVNDGKQPRSVVDCDGIALLEYGQLCGDVLDAATQTVVALSKRTTMPLGQYRITYRIPLVEQQIDEPLRTRMLLPVHTYPQDPVLTVTFGSLANICTSGAIGELTCDVILLRRVPTKESETLLQKTAGTNPNGYIDFDLIETPFSVAPGITGEQRFQLPIPGEYANLMFRQYLGKATPITRDVIDFSGTGGTVALGFGAESIWRLETGLVSLRQWRWNHLQTLAGYNQNVPIALLKDGAGATVDQIGPIAWGAIASAGAITVPLNIVNGVIGWNQPTGSVSLPGFSPACSTIINFLTDGVSGSNANELGSLLDCNTPANNGLKMEIIGPVVAAATNSHFLKVMGRRFFGDLRRWTKFA